LRRRVFLGAVVAGLLLPHAARAQAPAEGGLAVVALRLATLAERVAKLQTQAAHGVLVDRSRRALVDVVRQLDGEARRARSRGAAPEVRDNLLLFAVLWDELKPWALRAPSRENARKVVERTEEAAWVAEKAAAAAGAEGSAVGARDAQRVALLSQRLPRLHLSRRGTGEEGQREVHAAEAELRRTLASLSAGPGNTTAALAELQLAENQLEFLAPLAPSRDPPARRLEFVAKAGDHLLESMTRLVRIYES
jgi:hypothetical protein